MAIQKHKTYSKRSGFPAKGTARGNTECHLVRVAIGFRRDKFDIINALAAHKGISFGEAARQLIDAALASDEIGKKVLKAA